MANGNMGKPSCHHFWCTQTLKLAYWTTCTTSQAGEKKFSTHLGGCTCTRCTPPAYATAVAEKSRDAIHYLAVYNRAQKVVGYHFKKVTRYLLSILYYFKISKFTLNFQTLLRLYIRIT